MRWIVPIVLAACGGGSSMSGSSGTGGNTDTLLVQANGGSLTIPGPGGMLQLGAYMYTTDGYGSSMLTPVTVSTWSSSSTSVATVDKNGLVTAVAAGSAQITANADTGSGSATVMVGGSSGM